MFHSVSLPSQAPLARGSCALPSVLCSMYDKAPCGNCNSLIYVANQVLCERYITLPEAFRKVSPQVKYDTSKARRKLLPMPLVTIRVGNPDLGYSFILLLERYWGVD